MSRSLTPGAARLAALAALLVLPAAAVAAEDTGPTQPAYLTVRVPADAKLQIADKMTQQTGEVRQFVSPPLSVDAKKKYTYTLKATFKGKDGKEVTVQDTVQVYPGKTTEVDLRKPKDKKDDTKKDDTKKDDSKKDDKNDDGKKDDKKDDSKKDDKKDEGKKDDKAGVYPKRKPDVAFVPTPQEVVDTMLEVAAVKKNDVVYDLGCGDGVVLVTAAKKYGCKAYGCDIDPKMVKEAKESAAKEKVEDLVTVEEKDIFAVDLKKATVVTLYLLEEVNAKLVPQLEQMKAGSRVVSHDFRIPGYKLDKEEKVIVAGKRTHTVLLYTIPLQKEK
jgi:uncharacterized protein (TIGR03000 family)